MEFERREAEAKLEETGEVESSEESQRLHDERADIIRRIKVVTASAKQLDAELRPSTEPATIPPEPLEDDSDDETICGDTSYIDLQSD